MKRLAKQVLWLALALTLGWSGMSVWLRRSVSAVWKDTPLAVARPPYPAALRGQTQGRLERIAHERNVVGLAAWLNEIASETSPDRLRAAIDAAKALPDKWRTFATRVALERLADVDPGAALDFALLRLGNGTPAWNALANLLRLRAGSDPGQVRPFLTAAAMQLTKGHGGVAELGRLRAAECWDVISRLHLPLDDPGVQECLGGIAEVNPRLLVESPATLDPDQRRSAVRAWAPQDPEAALTWLQAHPEPGNDWSIRMAALLAQAKRDRALTNLSALSTEQKAELLRALSSQNATVAAAALSEMTEDERLPLAGKLVGRYVTERSTSALGWLEGLPPDLRGSPTLDFYVPVASDDLPRWLSLGVQARQLDFEVSQNFRDDTAAGLEWFGNLPPAAQTGALTGAVDGLAEIDPQQAADLLSTQPRGQRWSEAVRTLARKWGAYDPVGARAWIDTLPPETAKEAAKAAGTER